MLVDQPDVPPEEHKPDIEATRKKIDLESNYWKGRVFLTHGVNYATEYGSNEKISLSELSDIILERFPADKHIFWGAELHKPPKDLEAQRETIKTIWQRRHMQPYGCVIFYHGNLTLPNKEIDESYCHVCNC